MSDKIIEFDHVVAGYSPSLTILNETTLDARARRDHAADRPQRRRQVDGAEDAVRHARRRARARSASRARTSTASRSASCWPTASRSCRRGATCSARCRCATTSSWAASRCRAASCPARIEEVLARFPRIRERIDNQASTMSGGEQKQLEVGRALLLRPRVLLIDEPSIGLSPKLVQDVMTLLRKLADDGTTVLMVEQNVRTALKYANRALVLEMGRLALDRPASRAAGRPGPQPPVPRRAWRRSRRRSGCRQDRPWRADR